MDALEDALAAHFPHGYTCGDECPVILNSPRGWARHVAAVVRSQVPAIADILDVDETVRMVSPEDRAEFLKETREVLAPHLVAWRRSMRTLAGEP